MKYTPTDLSIPQADSGGTQSATSSADGRRRGPWTRRLLASSSLLAMLAAGSAFGANKGCVSAPMHGTSVVVGSNDATTTVTFSGGLSDHGDYAVIVVANLGDSNSTTYDGAQLTNMIPIHPAPIYPDADGNFSVTIDVKRSGYDGSDFVWRDDDAVAFGVFEIASGRIPSLLDTYHLGSVYTKTQHGIAAVSDRPDPVKLPHVKEFGFGAAPFGFKFNCNDTAEGGDFVCPTPFEGFSTDDWDRFGVAVGPGSQLGGNFLTKKLPRLKPSNATTYTAADYLTDAEADGAAYYASFPENEQYKTLTEFKAYYNFYESQDACKTQSGGGAGQELCAWYRNEMDLGFGRQMHCRSKPSLSWGPGKFACYVTNFRNEDEAYAGNDPIEEGAITVAMTWTPNGTSVNRVRFYAYDNAGNRFNSAALDAGGSKSLPGLCLNCHGGEYDKTDHSVTGTHFLPFDELHLPTASQLPDQSEAFKMLNISVFMTELYGDDGDAEQPISQLIGTWYNNPDEEYQGAAVPDGWSENPALYLGVVAPYCRSCHVAQTFRNPALGFSSLADFMSLKTSILSDVCGDTPSMPHAQRTYQRFWESGAPAILATELGPYNGAYDSCRYKDLVPVELVR